MLYGLQRQAQDGPCKAPKPWRVLEYAGTAMRLPKPCSAGSMQAMLCRKHGSRLESLWLRCRQGLEYRGVA